MQKRSENTIKPSEITPESVFMNRRTLLQAAAAAGLLPSILSRGEAATIPANGTFTDVKKWAGSTTEKANTFAEISSYNNYYEFGTDKGDPAENAHTLKTSPWSVQVTGAAAKTGTYTLEDILAPHALEERIYRLRCVEAWSMVIPWVGFPLADLVKRFEPTSQAKYVQFFTLNDRDADARTPLSRARVALSRGPHDRGSDASARARGRRRLRQGHAKPEWRADTHGHPVEVRVQELQSRSSASTSPIRNRRRAGTWPRRKSTGSTRT